MASPTASESNEDVPLNVEQACHFLGDMPKPTLYFKCNKGDMPHVKQGGRLYFFKKELVGWLRNYTVISSEKKAAHFKRNTQRSPEFLLRASIDSAFAPLILPVQRPNSESQNKTIKASCFFP